jgi:hypothetical protein
VESQLLGFPCFPYSVICRAYFGNAFHKVTIAVKARLGNRNHLSEVATRTKPLARWTLPRCAAMSGGGCDRLIHKEGDPCDQLTQADAGRTPALPSAGFISAPPPLTSALCYLRRRNRRSADHAPCADAAPCTSSRVIRPLSQPPPTQHFTAQP